MTAPQAGTTHRPTPPRPVWFRPPPRRRSRRQIAGAVLSVLLLAGLVDVAVARQAIPAELLGFVGGSATSESIAAATLALGLGSTAPNGLAPATSPAWSDEPPTPGASSPDASSPTGPTAGIGPQVGPPAWPTPDELIQAAASVNLVYHVKTSRKVVALTFDDGWSAARGREILDILVRDHVAATFFVNSVYVRWNPGFWRQVALAGFPIGNHTYDHRNLTTLTPAQVVADLQKDAREFLALTGHPMAPVVRPPYGARNLMTDGAMVLAGYPDVILWNVVANDAEANAIPAREIADATRGGPGSIVLLHVGPVTTPRILQAVIDSYRNRGFSFVTIPQLLALQPSH